MVLTLALSTWEAQSEVDLADGVETPMPGMSYFWLDPARKIAAAIMTETYWQVNPLGWKEDMDDLDQARLYVFL